MEKILVKGVRSVFNLLDWQTQQQLLELRARVKRPSVSYSNYSYDNVATDAKHSDPVKLIDRFLRYQKCLGEDIAFEGRTVLEIGAGPLLGWAFLALALGAKQYYVLEPASDGSELTRFQRYFDQHRRYVNRILGTVDELDDLIENRRIMIINGNANDTGLPDNSIDLVVSNSVLEHVNNIPEVVSELRRVTTQDSVQYHIVNFKDHSKQRDPFSRLYPFHPDDIRRLRVHRGLVINMLREPDLKTDFSVHFDTEPTIFFQDSSYPSIQNAHPYWKERYTPDELGIEVAAIKATPA